MKNRRIIRNPAVVAVFIVLAGLLLGAVLVLTAPVTQPEEKAAAAKIVRTIIVEPRTERIIVHAGGTVIPARRVSIKPRVGGNVIRIHESLVPGGYLGADEELIRIDPADYELDLAEQESALEESEFELALEEGRQVVAQRELKLLQDDLAESDVNQSLVLRQPHLRRIEAMVRSATNEIARAQLALSRTSVHVPFNAMVLAESVELGQLVREGEEIATLVGSDEFWVQASLDVDKLRLLALPGPNRPGARAQVILDAGPGKPVTTWSGTVARLLSDMETTSRMARMLVSVKDPLRLKSDTDKLPLLLGSYVRVEIEAGTLENVIAIPRVAMRENDSIWVVDSEDRLQIRATERLWSQDNRILIANVINPGEQLIVSGLRTALPGMEVEAQLVDADSAGAPEPALSSISGEDPIQSTP